MRGRTGSSVTALTRQGSRVQRERLARPDRQHEGRAQGGTEDQRQVPHALRERTRRLQLLLGDGLGQQPGVGRLEERPGGTEDHLDRRDLPHACATDEDQCGQDRVHGGPDQVAADHQAVAREPVRPHSTKQHQHHQRDRLSGQDQAQVAGRPGRAGDVDGHRHRDRV